jgi:hypothetical protein
MVWTPTLNAVLGSLVLTVGFWLMAGELSVPVAAAIALGSAGFLAWRGTTVGAVWAWATLLLGLESLAWPITTMVRIHRATAAPTDEQMGQILTSFLFGGFAAIFWMSFAYGIFRRIGRPEGGTPAAAGTPEPPPSRRKRRGR